MIQRRSVSSERILGRHESIVGKRVHQLPLLHHLLVGCLLAHQVPVVVVGHDDALILAGQVEDEAVVVAHDSTTGHVPGRSQDQDSLLFQLEQDALVCCFGRRSS